MLHSSSLRFQINLRIVLTSLIILIAGGLISIWQARTSVKTELDSSLNLASQLIQLNFADINQHDAVVDVDSWLPRFVSLEQTRHLTIQIQQPSGNIVSFSAKADEKNKPKPPQWFVRLISAESPKIEQQLTDRDGEQTWLIIQANPLDEIGEAWKECRAFFSVLIILIIIIFLTVNLLFNASINTIAFIVEALKEIEQGNYRQRLPTFATAEYDRIAKAINHMSAVMDVTSKENKALTRHTLQIQEDERQHLAKELHNELGQSLTAIKVMASMAKNDNAKTEQIADTIISVSDHLITVVRLMMRNLHPMALTELGLKAGLEDLLNHWSQNYPELSLKFDCPEQVDKIEQSMSIQIFRIVQEGLTNMIRHAQATEGYIALDIGPDKTLLVEVSDNGKGCSLNETKKGFGLLGVRERIKSLGGELSIRTAHQQGMTLFARIPLA